MLGVLVFIIALGSLISNGLKSFSFIDLHPLFFILLLLKIAFDFLATIQSNNPADAIYFLSRDFLGYSFLILVYQYLILDRKNLLKIFLSLTVVSVVVVFYGLYEIVNDANFSSYSPEIAYLIKGGFAHRNLYAQILVLLLPILVYTAFLHKGFARGFLVIMSAIQFFLMVMLYCRSAWIATAVALFFVGLIFVYQRFSAGEITTTIIRSNRGKSIFFKVSVVLLAMVLGFVLFADIEEVIKLLRNLGKWDYGSVKKRLDVWAWTWELIKSKPFMGYGLGAWKVEILKYISGQDISEGNKVFYQRPHNDFLWTWMEAGVFSFIFYISLFVYSISLSLKLIVKKTSLESQKLAFLSLFGLISYLVISNLSFPSERTEHNVLLLIYLTIPLTLIENKRNDDSIRIWNILLHCSFLIGAVFSIYLGYQRFNGEKNIQEGLNLISQNKLDEALIKFNKAENIYYTMDATSTPISWYRGMLFYQMTNYERASIEFEQSILVNPYHVHALNNLASSYYQLERFQASKEKYKSLLEIDSQFSEAYLNMAVIYYGENKLDTAIFYLQKIDTLDLDSYWENRMTIIMADHIEEIIRDGKYEDQRSTLRNIQASPEWMRTILVKSGLNQISYEDQIKEDLDYMLNQKQVNISTENQ